jgi:hypothetical protein
MTRLGDIGHTVHRFGDISGNALRRFSSSPLPKILKGVSTGLGVMLDPLTDGISGEVASGFNSTVNALSSKTAQGIAGGISSAGAALEKYGAK